MERSEGLCCICNITTTNFMLDKNIFSERTDYSETHFYRIIEEFLQNPLHQIIIKNETYLACSKCSSKINEYDLAIITYKRLQDELAGLIQNAETKFQNLLDDNQEDDLTVLNPEYDALKLDSNDGGIIINESVNSADSVNIKCENELILPSTDKSNIQHKHFCAPCNMNLIKRKDFILHCRTRRHLSIVNGTIPFQCIDCGKKLLTEIGLRDHITLFHTNERNHLCSICNKYFATRNMLSYHRNREHPDAFRCPICHKRLISSYLTMEEHIMYIHEHKPVECRECNIKYKNLHSLYQHRKAVHINKRLYQCELCGKKFNENNALLNHIKFTHEKIKNFACDLCNFKTTTKTVLLRHKRIHTGEKKFKCEVCGKNFVAKYNLIRHMNTLHNNAAQ